MNSSFWKSGHTPTLFAAFLYFDLSFMVWYLLGLLAVQIAADLHLTTQQRGLVVATPILAGAVLRFVMGMLADRLSPKTAGLIGQVIVICALFGAWKLGIHSYEQALLLGLFLGMAGASFAVALPWPRNGIRRSIKAKPWASPAPATRHGVRRVDRPGAGGGLWLEQRVRLRPDSADPDPDRLRLAGEKRARAAESQVHGRLLQGPGRSRQLVVHVFLQRDLRRLHRPGQRPARLFQRPVRPEPGDRGLLHGGLRVRRQPDAPTGRRAG